MGSARFGSAADIMAFQNTRGGRVQILTTPMPDTDYYSEEKGAPEDSCGHDSCGGAGGMPCTKCQAAAACLLHLATRRMPSPHPSNATLHLSCCPFADPTHAAHPPTSHPPTPIPCMPRPGDALYAFEVALALERLAFDRMRDLHGVADKADDFQAQDFIEAFMTKQAR